MKTLADEMAVVRTLTERTLDGQLLCVRAATMKRILDFTMGCVEAAQEARAYTKDAVRSYAGNNTVLRGLLDHAWVTLDTALDKLKEPVES